MKRGLTLYIRETFANSEDPNEMQHQGLHCLLILKQSSGTEIHQNLENSNSDPLKVLMVRPELIVSICVGKSIRIQRVKKFDKVMHTIHLLECIK